jgi:hypothetical protein
MAPGLVIKQNNFGFVLTFTIVNADTTLRNLSGMTVTFYVYTQEQEPTLLLSGACTLLTQSGSTLGQCTYTVAKGNFPTPLTYNCELEMTMTVTPTPPPVLPPVTTFLEDTETFTLNVIPQHPAVSP